MLRRLAVTLAVLATVAACASVRHRAEGRFTPAEAGVLTVATSLPAPGFWDGDQAATVDGGFEWGLATALAERFGLRLRVVDVPFERLVAGDLGGADLALAEITITDARKKAVDFSVPYYMGQPTALAPAGTKLADLATARTKRWAVQRGTTQEQYVRAVIRPDQEPILVDSEPAAADAVASGAADMALLDLPTALVIAKERPALEAVARFARDELYAAALPRGSRNLDVVNAALRAFAADGTLTRLADQWLKPRFATPPSSVPLILAR